NMVRRVRCPMADSNLHIKIAVRLLLFVPFAGVLLFLPAGTFEYWEAWVFIPFFSRAIFCSPYISSLSPDVGNNFTVRLSWRLFAFVLPLVEKKFAIREVVSSKFGIPASKISKAS